MSGLPPVIDFQNFCVYYNIGERGSGKSALQEIIAEKHKEKGRLVIDCWGARNAENFFWFLDRNGIDPHPKHKVLVILPDYTTVNVPKKFEDHFQVVSNKEKLIPILRRAKEENRVVVFGNTFFQYNHSYSALAQFFEELLDTNVKLGYEMFVLLREAGNLFSSYLMPCKEAKDTRVRGLQLVREARHANISISLDAHMFGEILKGLRLHSDRILVKKTTKRMLPDFLQFIPDNILYQQKKYRYNPQFMRSHPRMDLMKPFQYYCVWGSLKYYCYTSQLPTFRHKEARDVFTKLTGIDIDVDKEKMAEAEAEAKKKSKTIVQMPDKEKGSSGTGVKSMSFQMSRANYDLVSEVRQITKETWNEFIVNRAREWKKQRLKTGTKVKED